MACPLPSHDCGQHRRLLTFRHSPSSITLRCASTHARAGDARQPKSHSMRRSPEEAFSITARPSCIKKSDRYSVGHDRPRKRLSCPLSMPQYSIGHDRPRKRLSCPLSMPQTAAYPEASSASSWGAVFVCLSTCLSSPSSMKAISRGRQLFFSDLQQ
jgi:hypothetical protein